MPTILTYDDARRDILAALRARPSTPDTPAEWITTRDYWEYVLASGKALSMSQADRHIRQALAVGAIRYIGTVQRPSRTGVLRPIPAYAKVVPLKKART